MRLCTLTLLLQLLRPPSGAFLRHSRVTMSAAGDGGGGGQGDGCARQQVTHQ
jgi:hypothetical protein